MSFVITVPSNGDLANGNGYVNIFFPVGFLFDKSATIACTVMGGSVTTPLSSTCTPSLTNDPNNMGKYLSKITGDLKCGNP